MRLLAWCVLCMRERKYKQCKRNENTKIEELIQNSNNNKVGVDEKKNDTKYERKKINCWKLPFAKIPVPIRQRKHHQLQI